MTVEFWRFGPAPDVELHEFGKAARRFEQLGWDGFTIGSGILPGAKMSLPPGHGGSVPLIPPHHPHTALALAAASTKNTNTGRRPIRSERMPNRL